MTKVKQGVRRRCATCLWAERSLEEWVCKHYDLPDGLTTATGVTKDCPVWLPRD